MTAPRSLADLRRDYRLAGLAEVDVAPTWPEQFERWFADAQSAGLREPNAVVLATATPDGRPSARTVLLKAYDERGLVVFTNLASRKGREVAANPQASLVFPWIDLERQVVVCGTVEPVPREQTAAYFRSRPRGAQLSAWASRQSSVVASRAELEQRRAAIEVRFAGRAVPVPDFWGGLRVVPETVEFWQGRPDRLHDRLQFRRTSPPGQQPGWLLERLAP